MKLSLLVAGLWMIAASGAVVLPRGLRNSGAVALVVSGIPLAGWITYETGPIWGMLAIGLGTLVLRWPLHHLWGRLRRPKPGPAE